MKNIDVLEKIKEKLIVSCQALESEPLYSDMIMGRMAYAAMLGGAAGIRANTPKDILRIKQEVKLPVIGLTKRVFDDCDVYITPTMEEIDALHHVNCEIIALDATNRVRPNGQTLDELMTAAREKYPDQLFMADISTPDEGIHAQELGFDLVSTTLSGYTAYTQGMKLPDFGLMAKLVKQLMIPVIGEGGIWSPEELRCAMDQGVFACVVGTAITRPMDITKRFVRVLEG